MRVIKLLVIPLLLLAPRLWAQPSIVVPYSLSFGDAIINFGSVPVGSSRDTVIVLENDGCVTLSIGTLKIEGPFSSMDTSGISLPFAEADSIHMRFRPTKVGLDSGSINIHLTINFTGQTSSGDTTIVLPLVGTGVAPESVSQTLGNGALELTAYPNPVVFASTISYNLSETGQTEVSLYTTTGNCILSLENGYQFSGSHVLPISTRILASGDYFCRLTTTAADGTVHSASCKLVIQK